MYLCYGNRIESLSDQSIQPLIYSQSDDVCISWIKVVLEFIEKRVFPFFKCVDSPDKLNDFLNFGFPSCKKYFSCTPEQYIRLLAFTNFVLGKKEEAVSYVAEAFHQLDVNSTISTTIIEKRKAELQHLLDLLSLSVDIQQEYIQETISNTLNNLYKIIEENLHDEIQLYNITIPKDSKHPGKTKTIVVPCTKSEINVINDDSVNFMATQVPYHEMDKIRRGLRPKYQRALKGILFRDVCDQVLSIKSPSRILRNIDMNGLKVLIQSFPDSFG